MPCSNCVAIFGVAIASKVPKVWYLDPAGKNRSCHQDPLHKRLTCLNFAAFIYGSFCSACQCRHLCLPMWPVLVGQATQQSQASLLRLPAAGGFTSYLFTHVCPAWHKHLNEAPITVQGFTSGNFMPCRCHCHLALHHILMDQNQ